MKKKIVLSVSAFLIILIFSGAFSGKDDTYFEIAKGIDVFTRVYKEISMNYVDDINPEQFMRSGIQGMLGSLDPYTVFIDEKRKDDIDLLTNGKYGGVGISIGVRNNEITVVEILDGFSAQRQGLRIGDVIINVSGKNLTADDIDEISSLVKGEPGSYVEMKITRDENKDTLIFNLLREEIVVKNLSYYGFFPPESNNVYLKLISFNRSASEEIRKALNDLQKEKNIESIVLDLRWNPGGLLDAAVEICDKFLEKDKLIVTTKGRDSSTIKNYYATQKPLFDNTKLAVLVNEGSASASEIVAGAIQDHDRGIIVGTKTFGKGLVQTISPLSYNTSLKITTSKYYTPSGRCIQKIDYTHKNKVFEEHELDFEGPFYTSANRLVYGSGGITPDTVIEMKYEGEITKYLLAKGMFFKFATYYENNNKLFNDKTLNENIFKEFKSYLNSQNFSYVSESEKKMDELILIAEKNKSDKKLIAELNKLKIQFDSIADLEMDSFKKEIIKEIRSELSIRFNGREGRTIELLSSDEQFNIAYKILNDNMVYNSILRRN